VPILFSKLSQLWRRLLFYLRRERFDRDLEEEMLFHLEMRAQENAEAGMGPEETRYATQRQFHDARSGRAPLLTIVDPYISLNVFSLLNSEGNRRIYFRRSQCRYPTGQQCNECEQ
jgi:hypothetical protein